VSASGISWVICKSAPWLRQITMPASHHSVFYRPDVILPPTNSPKALKAYRQDWSAESYEVNFVTWINVENLNPPSASHFGSFWSDDKGNKMNNFSHRWKCRYNWRIVKRLCRSKSSFELKGETRNRWQSRYYSKTDCDGMGMCWKKENGWVKKCTEYKVDGSGKVKPGR